MFNVSNVSGPGDKFWCFQLHPQLDVLAKTAKGEPSSCINVLTIFLEFNSKTAKGEAFVVFRMYKCVYKCLHLKLLK